jgi:hypothetical protein
MAKTATGKRRSRVSKATHPASTKRLPTGHVTVVRDQPHNSARSKSSRKPEKSDEVGVWEEPRSAEEIIEDIYSRR